MLRNKNTFAQQSVSCVSGYPTVLRTESDRAANGIQSGGERNPIGRRTESDQAADGALRGCTCLKCTNRGILMLLLVGVALAWLVGALLTWLVHLRQVHPPEESVEE